MNAIHFPKGFEGLAQFAPDWVLRDQSERQQRRSERSLETVKTFYHALAPEMERIIGYLNTVPMDAMQAADKNLYRLAATWMEMSHPVDLRWNDTDERNVFPFERVHISESSPAD